MPKTQCFHCHKRLPTVQGLNTHLLHRRPCNEAYQILLAAQHIRTYDPGDPDDHPRDDEPLMDWDITDGLANLEDSLDMPETMEAHNDVNPAGSQSERSVQPCLTMEPDTTTMIQYPGPVADTYGLALTLFETCKVFITLLIGVSMVETLFTPVYGTVH